MADGARTAAPRLTRPLRATGARFPRGAASTRGQCATLRRVTTAPVRRSCTRFRRLRLQRNDRALGRAHRMQRGSSDWLGSSPQRRLGVRADRRCVRVGRGGGAAGPSCESSSMLGRVQASSRRPMPTTETVSNRACAARTPLRALSAVPRAPAIRCARRVDRMARTRAGLFSVRPAPDACDDGPTRSPTAGRGGIQSPHARCTQLGEKSRSVFDDRESGAWLTRPVGGASPRRRVGRTPRTGAGRRRLLLASPSTRSACPRGTRRGYGIHDAPPPWRSGTADRAAYHDSLLLIDLLRPLRLVRRPSCDHASRQNRTMRRSSSRSPNLQPPNTLGASLRPSSHGLVVADDIAAGRQLTTDDPPGNRGGNDPSAPWASRPPGRRPSSAKGPLPPTEEERARMAEATTRTRADRRRALGAERLGWAT